MINIEIKDIFAGWLTFSIENCSFNVSWLSNFIEEMDELLCISYNDNMNVKRIFLDGEEEMLYLTAWRNNENFYLIWEKYGKENIIKLFKFDYSEFINTFYDAFNKIEDEYEEHFILKDDDGSDEYDTKELRHPTSGVHSI